MAQGVATSNEVGIPHRTASRYNITYNGMDRYGWQGQSILQPGRSERCQGCEGQRREWQGEGPRSRTGIGASTQGGQASGQTNCPVPMAIGSDAHASGSTRPGQARQGQGQRRSEGQGTGATRNPPPPQDHRCTTRLGSLLQSHGLAHVDKHIGARV